MDIRYDKAFLKEVQKLPHSQQRLLSKKLTFFQENVFDPRLHTKQLSAPLHGIFSFRVSREYRVLFRFTDEETVFLIAAKHRKEIYK